MKRRYSSISVVGLILFATCVLSFKAPGASAQGISTRIVGGQYTPELYKGPVAFVFTGRVGCSGVLVGSRTVLTAGHCSLGIPDQYRVVVGGHVFRTNSTSVHPFYNPSETPSRAARFDLGVITLSSTATVPAIPVFIDQPLAKGTLLTIAGYGTHERSSSDQDLRDAGKTGISVVRSISNGIITGDYFGGSASICPGDSGGPAIFSDSGLQGVVGIASIGINDVLRGNCVLAGRGDFGHAYLQSSTNLSFLRRFPDIKFLSARLIFAQSASRSALASLNQTLASSSINSARARLSDAVPVINRARSSVSGGRQKLLTRALNDTNAARKESSLSALRAKVRSAIGYLEQVVAMGIS